jgi:uncharacterized membrane protein
MDAYLFVKWLHILSSTILFGTGLGTALHMVLAHRAKDGRALAVVTRNVVRADWLCTLPSGIVQPATGVALIYLAGFDPLAPWLVASYVLFIVAAACWFIVVALQIRMARLADAAARANTPPPREYFRAYRLWFWLGWPAFLSLVAVFALMVMKPAL